MKDQEKTNEQLVSELEKLRQRITESQLSATEDKRTDEVLRESERELSIRNRIAEVFLSVPDDEMYGEVLQIVLDAMESKYGVFGYIEEDGALVCPSMTRDIWEQCLMADKDIVFPRETWGGIWGRALTEKKTLYSNKLLRVPDGHIPIFRALTVPIVHREEVIGSLLVGNKARDYEVKDKEMLEKIADRIAPILHARLQKEREEKERKRVERELLKRTHDLGERVKELRCLFGISRVIERQDATWWERFQEIVNLIPPAWQYPEITCARIMFEDQEFRTANFRETIWNQAKVITVDGKQVGTVEVCYLEETPVVDEGPFLREERSLIDAIAERLGRMIERKRNEERIVELSRALVKVQEIERQEISRDLHDNLAQDLSSLKISLDTLLGDRPEFSFGDREKASELSRAVQRSIGYVRDMIYDLHPAGLEHLGLAETIRVYCEEFAARNAKKVEFFSVGMGDLKLGFDTEIALYRLVQEGLANIEKHADASRITIRLSASFPHIILRIEDNGKGFDAQTRIFEALKERRMGLQIMEQRVALLNGEMVIDSRPRLGTKILVKVPIRGKH
ncbi:MAG: GAF domain-containing sensor histidine kinase [Deltaproteobacteria bacterium]|nr:MAG: GAF domain-containing sensor histidine kinase [Deltaproteobacteria bacterium]